MFLKMVRKLLSASGRFLADEDVEEKWLPGGGQLKTVHQDLGLLYILMHQGGEYTHHESRFGNLGLRH